MKTSEKNSGGKRVSNGITLHALIQKESEQKAARKLQAKHKAHERILKPFKADEKTVFLF